MELTDDQLLESMVLLGLKPVDFDEMRKAAPNKGPYLLDKIQIKARKNYKKVAREYHPDKNGGDEAKTEMFQAVTQVMEEIDNMAYLAPKRTYRWVLKLGGRLW